MKNTKENIDKKQAAYYDDFEKEFKVNFIPHKHGTYRIEIDDAIESVSQFSTAVQVLGLVSELDIIEIHLQGPGGNVDATDAFLHALHKTDAHVHVIATGGCHSAMSHILLCADSFELSEGFCALLHGGSDGAYGNVNEYAAKAAFDADFRTKQFKRIYEGFLTDLEMDNMLKGQDIWLDAEQWCKRAEIRHEYFKGKMEAMQQQETEALLAESFKLTKPAKAKKPKATVKKPAAPAKKPTKKLTLADSIPE